MAGTSPHWRFLAPKIMFDDRRMDEFGWMAKEWSKANDDHALNHGHNYLL